MKHIIETNEIHAPIQITINGETITSGTWKAKLSDPEPRPHFGSGFRPDITDCEFREGEKETEITLKFRGSDALKAREILAALMSGQNAESIRAEGGKNL